MTDIYDKEIDFIKLLRENKLKSPNLFTEGMGKLIRKAREEKGMSQAEFATRINRRPATVSDIENGKSEINVSSLVLFAIELEKPVSFFFPESIFRNFLVDVKSEAEHEILSSFREIIHTGDPELTLRIVTLLENYYSTE